MNIKSLGLSAILALLAAGCAAGTDDVWHGDTAFTLDERSAIESGAAFTAAHVGQPVPVIIWDGAPDYSHHERGIRREHIDQAKWGAPGIVTLAYGNEYGITFEPGLGSVQEAVAAHEFGHSFGLVHHAEPGLMNPIATHIEWLPADESEVR